MLPDSYSELWPGRFLKADMLKGRKVTLTIKNIAVEDLTGDKNKPEAKVVLSFVERPFDYVCPKTNGYCMKRMFGNNPHAWIGKRVTWFGTQCSFGREMVDCLRIWGSPDLPEDMPVTVPQGRKKPVEMTLHAVKSAHAIDPRIQAGLELLELSPQESKEFLANHAGKNDDEILAEVNELNKQRNAKETL